MRHLNADAGFVFNSDISRVSVVTNDAETLSEEYTFPLAVDRMISRKFARSSTIVTNSCTTQTLDDIAMKKGAQVDKTRVGQAPIIDRLLEIGAKAAGDGSGSFAMAEAGPAFDGFLAMGMILESMAANSATSSELSASLPKHHLRKLKITCPSSRAYTLLRNIEEHFPNAAHSEIDGHRFDWPNGWIHFRAAMTEPIIRVIIEWRTKDEAEERALRIRGLLERLVVS
jgi:phosphomannomutase